MILWKKSVGESREDSVCGLRELVIALFLNVLSATLAGPPSDKLRREMKTDRQTEKNERKTERSDIKGKKKRNQKRNKFKKKQSKDLGSNPLRLSFLFKSQSSLWTLSYQ